MYKGIPSYCVMFSKNSVRCVLVLMALRSDLFLFLTWIIMGYNIEKHKSDLLRDIGVLLKKKLRVALPYSTLK